MLKDIFIDNNIAKNFANPLDPGYKELVNWLTTFNKNNKADNAYLVVSRLLISEYMRTCCNSSSNTSIPVIISKLTIENRLINISNKDIKAFKRKNFKKNICNNFTCNASDRDLIPVVLLSYRRYCLSLDGNFINDLRNFPGFIVKVAKKPQDLPYK